MSRHERAVETAPSTSGHEAARLAMDVQYYLTLQPRQLPSRYLYDPLGSALFEAICRLPWYGVTRAEARLIARHRHEIVARCGAVSTVVELGSGSGEKLRALLEGTPRAGRLTVHLIDVSAAALEAATHTLAQVHDVSVVTHEAEYEDGLEAFSRRRTRGPSLALFLGSNIGNFDRPGAASLMTHVRSALGTGQWLLLGADLVKPEAELLVAYDDPLGVTAAFNLNLLARLNAEIGADFPLDGFAHRAVWNDVESRIEMHLVSRRAQHVHIELAGLDLDLEAGESIWTESSYKYRPEAIVALVEQAGFRCRLQWIDPDNPFALTLFQAV